MAAILYVVADSGALTSAETTIKTRLETTLGHTVTLADDSGADSAASGKAAVVVSAAANATTLGTKYKTATCGVLSHHRTHWLNLGMCASPNITTQKYFGSLNAGHPLAGGLSGNVEGYSVAVGQYKVASANLGSNAVIISSAFSGGADDWNYFAYNRNKVLRDGTIAAGRRVAMSLEDLAIPSLTADGYTLWDAAVAWAASTNQVPTADAGSDQDVGVGDEVTLNGAGSSDPDGSISAYSWRQISGPAVTLSSTTAVSPTFDAGATGVYVFGLVVVDNTGDASTEDTVTVNAIQAAGLYVATSGSWVHKPLKVATSGSWVS